MPTRVTSTAFIGRQPELAELTAALQRATAGEATVALVGGESGVGKSRLLDQFAVGARADGARVLWGDCLELGEGELPYAPIVSALRPLARNGDPVLDELGEARAELARLLPELGAIGDLRVEPLAGSGQLRMFELLLGLFERLARDQPVVVVMEDLHWADRSTREFVAYLARNLCQERVVLVCSYRSDELHRRHPLRPLLAEVERLDRVRRIGLVRFTRSELAAQLRDILAAEPSSQLLDRLWRRSEGNPLYTEELVAAGRDGTGDLPDSLRDALMLRIEALSEPTQELLRWVAAAQRATDDVLADVTDMDARVLRDSLREAVAHHVLVGHDDGTFAFRHALLREAVADDLLPGERNEFHEALARALELRILDDPCIKLDAATEIAHHYDVAGDQPNALGAAVRAADAAERVHASGEAAALYERALELWDRVPDAQALTGLDHVDLLHRTARVQDDKPTRAAELIRHALDEVDRDEEPLRAAALLERLGKVRWQQAKGEAALAAYDEALELLAGGPPSAERAQVMASKAGALMLWSRFRAADALCAEAIEDAIAADAAIPHMHALNTRGVARQGLGESEQAEAFLREATEMARATGTVAQLVRCYVNLSDVLHLSGRTGEAYQLLHDGIEEFQRLGHRGTWPGFQLAEMAFHLGLWDESEALTRPDIAARQAGLSRIFYDLRRAELELGRGEHDAARERLERLQEATARSLEPQWHSPIYAMLGGLHLRERDLDSARSAVARGLERLEVDGEPTEDAARLARVLATAAGVEAAAAQQARDLGRPGDEAEAATRAADYAARGAIAAGTAMGRATPETVVYATVAAAEAAAAGGHPDPELWAGAADQWAAIQRPYRMARCRWREADARLDTGDRAGAQSALSEAYDTARDVGAEWLTSALETLARRARLRLPNAGASPTAPAAPPEPDGPAAELGLTPREREVLALVAQGATNREIGERLYMAEKTASVHVSRILAKLDVRSRTEAAAVAHRLGLAGEEPAPLSR